MIGKQHATSMINPVRQAAALFAKRLLFATEGHGHQTVVDFAADLTAHGSDPAEVRHVCMDVSAACAPEQASVDLAAWPSWARRCRLEPFKKLSFTRKNRIDAVVRGMTDHRSNAFVKATNGLLQQAKRAARGFRTTANFIAIGCLHLPKTKHLPAHPSGPAAAQRGGRVHETA